MKYHYKISICLDQKTFKNVNIQKHHSTHISMFDIFLSEIIIFILRCFWDTIIMKLAMEHRVTMKYLRTCGNIIKIRFIYSNYALKYAKPCQTQEKFLYKVRSAHLNKYVLLMIMTFVL